MGTKLNPDGAKIRALRIQRGWTQEQLAEISGISLRTVQRAEAASSAAFDTMKAIAAAFQTDFDRLLKPEPIGDADPGTPPRVRQNISSADPVPEVTASKRTAPVSWGFRATPIIAASALAAGLIIGIAIKSRVPGPMRFPPVAFSSVSKTLPDAPIRLSELQLQKSSPRFPSVSESVSDIEARTPTSSPEIANGIINDIVLPNPGSPAARPVDATESASPEPVLQSSPSELLLPLHVAPIVIPHVPVRQAVLTDDSGGSIRDIEDSGAVRQAVSLAAKKTSGFVSRAGASVKRAF